MWGQVRPFLTDHFAQLWALVPQSVKSAQKHRLELQHLLHTRQHTN